MRKKDLIRKGTLEEANRFLKGHPDDNPSAIAVYQDLDALITRVQALEDIHFTQQSVAEAANTRRAEIRDDMRERMVTLIDIGKAVAKVEPAVTVPHKAVKGRTNDAVFLTTARAAVAEATTYKAAFLKLGMPEDLPVQIGVLLDEFEGELKRRSEAMAAHVAAAAEIPDVIRAAMGMLRHIDSLNRLRFRKNPELLAAWKAARNLPFPKAGEAEATTPAGGSTKSA